MRHTNGRRLARALVILALLPLLLPRWAVSPAVAAPSGVRTHAWIVADADRLIAALPPAGPVPTPPPAPPAAELARWAEPVVAWIDIELAAITAERPSPPRAGRTLALLSVGLSDGLLVAARARARGLPIDDDALLASIARPILSYAHPALAESFARDAEAARWVGVRQGRATPSHVEASGRLGAAVAEAVLAFARADGADRAPSATTPPPGPGVWRPTPPAFAPPLEPLWGEVRPIGFRPDEIREVRPPPPWDSERFRHDRAEFLAAQRNLDEADRALARRWAGGPGTVTPGGQWFEIARELARRDRLGNVEAAQMFAAVGIAVHDGFVLCWRGKYAYWVARPITWMREFDPGWEPVIPTPPFPAYPSGHATISGAASTVLTAFFPADWRRLHRDAEDAARSRIVGGIHWPLDGESGLGLGRRVGARVALELVR